jgi:hypothetical protein
MIPEVNIGAEFESFMKDFDPKKLPLMSFPGKTGSDLRPSWAGLWIRIRMDPP